jgi:hypothetical protein
VPLPLDWHAPDDASELDPDRDRWLREQRMATRLGRWGARLSALRVLGRARVNSVVLIVVLIALASFASLAVALMNPAGPPPAAAPLAQADAAPGTPGALLPAVTLTTSTGTLPARAPRPAVLALVPVDCDCQAELNETFRQAAEFRLRLWLVAPPDGFPAVRRIATDVGNGSAAVAEDTSGRLRPTYRAVGLTLLFIRSDGRVDGVLRDAHAPLRLEAPLSSLDSPASGDDR